MGGGGVSYSRSSNQCLAAAAGGFVAFHDSRGYHFIVKSASDFIKIQTVARIEQKLQIFWTTNFQSSEIPKLEFRKACIRYQ